MQKPRFRVSAITLSEVLMVSSTPSLPLQSLDISNSQMTITGEGSHGFGDEVDDAKSLWTVMASLESRFEQQIEEVSRDLQQSFQQITNQLNEQLNEIQRSLRPRDNEVQHGVSPTPVEPSTKYNRAPLLIEFTLILMMILLHFANQIIRALVLMGVLLIVNGGTVNERSYFAPRHSDRQDYKLNIDLINFTGHSHMEEFMDWLTAIDKFFDYLKLPVEMKVKLVAYKLKGGASAWWDHLQNEKRLMGKLPITS